MSQRKQSLQTDTSAEMDGKVIGNYRIEKTIGQGTYGKVKLSHHIYSGVKFAIKIIEKAQLLNNKQIARLQREIRFLKLLHHPHIVKVYDVIETADTIYIAMEYEAGGELFDYIVVNKRVKEKEARSFYRMVLSAVDYCHQNSVIHRDLKPENLLLDEKKCIKIIDFGFGNNFTFDGLLDTFCGSPFYAAPEMILGKKYEGPEVDMWSLGVILFALLCGHLPFDDENMKELYKKIASGTYTCPDYLLPNARHLISRLITVDPRERATLSEVLLHPWVTEGYGFSPQNYVPERPIITDVSLLSKEIINRLVAFGYRVEDVVKAFGPEVDQKRPNPVRATYFLLMEMLQREETRQKSERAKIQLKLMSSGKVNSLSVNNIKTNSLIKIDESAVLQSDQESESGSYNNNETQPQKHISNNRPYASMQVLTTTGTSRRASTPEVSNYYPQPVVTPNTAPPCIPLPMLPSPVSGSLMNAVDYEFSKVAISNHQQSSSSFHSVSSSSSAPGAQSAQPAQRSIKIQPASESTQKLSKETSSITVTIPSQTLAESSSTSSTDNKRRSSMPLTSIPPRRGSMVKIKEELRAVSGWFLNVSTTSSKKPAEIMTEVIRVLEISRVAYKVENTFTLICEVEVDVLMSGGMTNDTLSRGGDQSASEISGEQERVNAKKGLLGFQIEVCKVPKLSLYGLNFRRMSGGVWNYKKVCGKLLDRMEL